MDDTDLIRRLVREFLLSENDEEKTNRLYNNWRNNFIGSVTSIRTKEYRDFLKDNLPPENYSEYNSWLNKPYDLFSTIGGLIDKLNGLVVKFKVNHQNKDNKYFLDKGYFEFNAILFFEKDPSLLKKVKGDSKYGEELIAEILRRSGVNAKRTKGEYDLYDIESDHGIFEVKSIWSDRGIRTGVTSQPIADSFKNLLLKAASQIEDFNNNIDNINLIDKQFLYLKNQFKIKVNELFEQNGYKSPNKNIDDLKKGNLPIPRSNLVKEIVTLAKKIQNILNQHSKGNEELQIGGSNINLDTPEKKAVYYEVIKKLKMLGVSIEIDQNDFNYVSSIIEDNLEEQIINFMNEELKPRKSFRDDLKGLFVIIDNSDNPRIAYIDESYINSKLSYLRTTVGRTKFTLKGYENLTKEIT
jgi:hypothetical protein